MSPMTFRQRFQFEQDFNSDTNILARYFQFAVFLLHPRDFIQELQFVYNFYFTMATVRRYFCSHRTFTRPRTLPLGCSGRTECVYVAKDVFPGCLSWHRTFTSLRLSEGSLVRIQVLFRHGDFRLGISVSIEF